MYIYFIIFQLKPLQSHFVRTVYGSVTYILNFQSFFCILYLVTGEDTCMYKIFHPLLWAFLNLNRLLSLGLVENYLPVVQNISSTSVGISEFEQAFVSGFSWELFAGSTKYFTHFCGHFWIWTGLSLGLVENYLLVVQNISPTSVGTIMPKLCWRWLFS